MAKFTYVGDPDDPEDSVRAPTAFGLRFPKGRPVDVTDKGAIAKLRNNPHFVEGNAPIGESASATASNDSELLARIEQLERENEQLRAPPPVEGTTDEIGPIADPDAGPAPVPNWRTFSKDGLIAWALKEHGVTLDKRKNLTNLQDDYEALIDDQDES